VVTTETHAPGGRAGRERGQALAELALVTPVLVLLLMAIFQFAFVFETQMGLTNAVREAARRAAAADGPTAAWVAGQLTGGGLLAQNVQGYTDTRLDPATDAPNEMVAFCSYDPIGGLDNQRITVTVSYRHPLFFPFLAYATDLADGTEDGDWTLTATAQMRLEHPLTSAPGGC
jgi:Flp pilus assembly protein TadG